VKLVFILGRWSSGMHGQLAPSDLYRRRALTGSESSFFNVARGLANFGHEVHIFCDTPVEEKTFPGLDGANVWAIDREVPWDADAYVSLNEPDQLRKVPQDRHKICWQQLGDFPGFVAPGFDEHVDKYVALSPVHLRYIKGASGKDIKAEKWVWIPNSTNIDLYEGRPIERDRTKMVWVSSPDRGLHRLLEIYPEVRRRVPGATLDIYYRFDPWYEQVKEVVGPIGDRARYVHECLRRLGRDGENGVTVVGPVPNVEMARVLRGARLLPYTCDCLRFTESFSVSILDAAAAGCSIILSDEDAIADIFGGVSQVIPGKPGRSSDMWTHQVARALTSEYDEQHGLDSRAAADYAKRFDRARVAALWERFLLDPQCTMPKTVREFVETEYEPRKERTVIVRALVTDEPPTDELERFAEEVVKESEETAKGRRPEIEVLDRKLRVAVILGKMGSPVHGSLDVANLWNDASSFVTGTVSGFFGIVWGLADAGHQVDAFCDCKSTVVGAGNLGGANVYRIDDVVIDKTYDAYISVNEPDLLRWHPKEKLRICAMWLNDFSFCKPGFQEFVDLYVCPSKSHLEYLAEHTVTARRRMTVIPISVNPEFHDLPQARRPGSVAYASSPDRGLHHLLELWTEIRAKVPEANLRIYYRIQPWYDALVADSGQNGSLMRGRADQIWRLLDELGRNSEHGVTVVGPVPPRKMAEELGATKVLAYTCDPVRYTEGFSVTILDACAAGCVPVVAGVDALPEVYWNAAHVIFGNPAERRQAWVDAICLGLTDDGFAAGVRTSAKAHARDFSRWTVARRWEDLIRREMAMKGAGK